ncbi:hypothetical protein [Paenibacillus sp. FSL W7-1332]|uniref:hypothetical protein n=1 Tax=Paenibacillus sp. FSL W7-1332 TaxID=2921702 RepID=UPI0030D23886
MLEMSMNEILKLAKEWGIEYEVDSATPGFFTEDDNGNEKQVSLEELLLIDPAVDLDNSISNALNATLNTNTKEIELGFMFFDINDTNKVAA